MTRYDHHPVIRKIWFLQRICGSRSDAHFLRLLILLLLVPCFFHAAGSVPSFAEETVILPGEPEGSENAYAKTAKERSMDLVLLIDMSGSMKYTDPDRMAEEGAMLFLELLKEDSVRVCLIGFSDKVEVIRPLQELDMDTESTQIRKALDEFPRERDTDLGAALKRAVEILDQGKEGTESGERDAAILLFTDGSIDLSSREEALRSAQEAEEAAAAAAGRGIPVYCIGLDDEKNETAYHLDSSLLKKLSAGGDGTFRYVKDADMLPDLFHHVVADCFDSTSGRIGDLVSGEDADGNPEHSSLQFEIPDRSAARANVILLPEDGTLPEQLFEQGMITLTDPEGTVVDADDTDRIRSSASGAYLVLKLYDPLPGVWTLDTRGDASFHVHVNLLFHYELEMQIQAEETENGTAQITAWFLRGGRRIMDYDLYRRFSASVQIYTDRIPDLWVREHFGREEQTDTAPEGNQIFEISLTPETDGSGYRGSFDLYPGKDFEVSAKAWSDSYEVSSGRIGFTSGGSGDIIVGNLPDEIILRGMFAEKTTAGAGISDWFQAWDGSGLSVDAHPADDKILSADAEEGELKLTGLKSGETVLHMSAEDRFGSLFEKDIPVRVEIRMEKILAVVRRAAFILLPAGIAALVIFLLRKKCRLSGTVILSLSQERSGQDEEYICPLPDRGRRISLIELIRLCGHTKLLQDPLMGLLPADRLYFVGLLRGNGCRICLKSGNKSGILVDCFGKTVRKTLLRDGDTFELTMPGPVQDRKNDLRGTTLFGFYEIQTE